MRVQFRLLASTVLPAALSLGLGAEAAAQDAHAHMDTPARASATAQPMRWSDPASWPGGKVPQAGDAVTCARESGASVGSGSGRIDAADAQC